jgi:hypothetical protein
MGEGQRIAHQFCITVIELFSVAVWVKILIMSSMYAEIK